MQWNRVSSGFLLAFFFVVGCSSQQGVFADRSSAYKKFIDSRLRAATLFENGKRILGVRAIPVSEELRNRQLELTPSHAIEVKKDVFQVVLGVDMATREIFMPEDFQFTLDGQKSTHVAELSNLTEIEQHYPFAYPYQRVFILDFDPRYLNVNSEKILDVQSPVGAAKISLFTDSLGSSGGQ